MPLGGFQAEYDRSNSLIPRRGIFVSPELVYRPGIEPGQSACGERSTIELRVSDGGIVVHQP